MWYPDDKKERMIYQAGVCFGTGLALLTGFTLGMNPLLGRNLVAMIVVSVVIFALAVFLLSYSLSLKGKIAKMTSADNEKKV